MASYRDKQCPLTLLDLFEQATYPERVFIGVHQQNSKQDVDCLVAQEKCPMDPVCKFLPQVRITRIDYVNATGPTGGRAAAQLLLRDEQFFLQIDTHLKFVSGWDERLIAEWSSINNDNAILSTYPLPSNNLAGHAGPDDLSNSRRQVPVICSTTFLGKESAWMAKHSPATYFQAPAKPRLVPYWASGFSFGPSHAIKAVPYDPHTPYLFDGEEMGMGLRLWTAGYDFYAPSQNLCYHLYSKGPGDKPKFWEVDWDERYPIQQKAARRLWVVLGFNLAELGLAGDYITDDIAKYGLGKKRTVAQYEAWTGIDLHKHSADHQRDPCETEFSLVPN